MILNNINIKQESYCQFNQREIVFIRRQQIEILIVILIFTVMLVINYRPDFNFWSILFAFILSTPLILYIGYSRRLVIELDSKLVSYKTYFFNKLFNIKKIIKIKDGENLYVKKMSDGDGDSWYTLYVRRKTVITLFTFKEIGTITLLKNELKDKLGIDLTFNPISNPDDFLNFNNQ